ncbi:hypothetical protein Y1Q_0023449 [Alligator mississippiensis]|uniref:Uncharacterized protein n=1 Tax=Alligator mississippiensis TaxID=8496 RepID=A0A151NPJ6_ALLMI|nr:hypothetical protein Y1Q_0023449 [Alligator mississippiensis]
MRWDRQEGNSWGHWDLWEGESSAKLKCSSDACSGGDKVVARAPSWGESWEELCKQVRKEPLCWLLFCTDEVKEAG